MVYRILPLSMLMAGQKSLLLPKSEENCCFVLLLPECQWISIAIFRLEENCSSKVYDFIMISEIYSLFCYKTQIYSYSVVLVWSQCLMTLVLAGNIEHVFVEANCAEPLIFGCVYLSPSTNGDVYYYHCVEVEREIMSSNSHPIKRCFWLYSYILSKSPDGVLLKKCIYCALLFIFYFVYSCSRVCSQHFGSLVLLNVLSNLVLNHKWLITEE